ncbi:hypothetical protein K502DRAFT_344658 [Neoconidiobolus thromboides FSU 785]|nr:hypothetical protein K502DRAFT_344658 [Neoconidiobolus thromboides FSU 785]
MMIANNNSSSSDESIIPPLNKMASMSSMKFYNENLNETLAICYLKRANESSHHRYCYSLQDINSRTQYRGGFDVTTIDQIPPDETQELAKPSIAKLGKSLAKMILPKISPDAYLTIISRSNDQLRPNLWSGFTTNSTLFFQPPCFDTWADEDFRTWIFSITAILELAENQLNCEKIVVCVHKDSPDIADLIKALFYVGFQSVHPSVYNQSKEYLLISYAL